MLVLNKCGAKNALSINTVFARKFKQFEDSTISFSNQSHTSATSVCNQNAPKAGIQYSADITPRNINILRPVYWTKLPELIF